MQNTEVKLTRDEMNSRRQTLCLSYVHVGPLQYSENWRLQTWNSFNWMKELQRLTRHETLGGGIKITENNFPIEQRCNKYNIATRYKYKYKY